MKRSYAIKALGIWPKGHWNRQGTCPPLWLARELERCSCGSAPSIYSAQVLPQQRIAPLPHVLAQRLYTRGEAPY